MKRPNILFLFSDQHNARCLGCYGHPQVKTPHLDRLAADGVRFENAYTQNPICTPSRISFLSSLYPSTHGYYGLYGPEPVQPMTSLFEYLRQQGYRTGALGKLHTPRYWIERHCQFVYDEFIEFPKYLEGAGLYDVNDNRAFVGKVTQARNSSLPYEHSCEMALARQTQRFIRNQGEPADRGDADAPWFAWVSFSRPHQPYTPSEPFASMYPAADIELPPWDESPKLDQMRKYRSVHKPEELRSFVSAYYGLISQADDAIGVILRELEDQGELENTIIVYSSDHGDYAGEHGLYEKTGGISYRAITRIPLIVRFPGRAGGGETVAEMAEAVDVFPTLCDSAGLDVPNHCQGKSLLPALGDDPVPVRESALTENPYRKALATKKFRFVVNLLDHEDDELYDLESDPWELHNRIGDPSYADVAGRMQRELLDRVVHARRPINTINGFWHNHQYDRDGRIDLGHCGAVNAYW